MEATKVFKETIKSYLDNRALEDKLFATSYAKENKNLDACVKYILGSVKESITRVQSITTEYLI